MSRKPILHPVYQIKANFFFLHDGIRLLMEKWPPIGVTVKDR
jgi:hypothetical protein